MQIDYIMGDDWEAVYVNGDIFAQNHSIDVHQWLDLLEKASFEKIEVRKWEFPSTFEGWAPTDLLDILETLEEY
jgi:hypothetical protein